MLKCENIKSKHPSELHKSMIGRKCIIVSMVADEPALILVYYDDGPHRIVTSRVIGSCFCSSDFSGNVSWNTGVTIETENSEYVFVWCDETNNDNGDGTHDTWR